MKRKARYNRRRIMALALLILFISWTIMGAVSFSGTVAHAAGEGETATEEVSDPVEENAGPTDGTDDESESEDTDVSEDGENGETEGTSDAEETSDVEETPDAEETSEPEETPEAEPTEKPEQLPKGIVDEATLKAAFEKDNEVKLDADIGMEEALTFSDGGHYILDLDGHNLYRSGERDKETYNEGGEVIHISGGSSLEITEGASYKVGKIYGGAAAAGGGIMIENGSLQATDVEISNNFSPKGGAIYVGQGSVSLTGVTLEQNGITEEGEVSDEPEDDSFFEFSLFKWLFGESEPKAKDKPEKSAGGAIYAEEGTTVNISNCEILSNKASNGGGIFNKGSLIIRDSYVNRNYAYSDGGGIYSIKSFDMAESSVRENKCENSGGGLYYSDSAVLSIDDCDFKNNHGEEKGGSIACENGELKLTDCEFYQNEVTKYGAGIYTGGGVSVSLKGVKADENHALVNYSRGGFAQIGGDLVIENSEITHGTAGTGGAFFMTGGKITLKGGRIYIYENTDNTFGKNNNIYCYKFKKIKIAGKFEKGSFIGVVPPDGGGDLTDDYSDYNKNTNPEELFSCDHDDYTILIDDKYPEVKAKKLLKATNSGYSCNIFIDVTNDVDWWDYCYVSVYGKTKNGRGNEKEIWESSDIQKYVDKSDGYYSKTGINCGEYFPTRVMIHTKFGTSGGWRDWEADVSVKVNGVNCGNTHIEVAGWHCFHKWTEVPVAASDYPYPADFEATCKRQIDSENPDDGIINLTAIDQYGVKWDNSGKDAITAENLNFPEEDKIEALDDTGLTWRAKSNLGSNHQSTYAFEYKTGSRLYPTFTQRVTVRFVFPLKVNIVMDDQVVATYKGNQLDSIEITPPDVKAGYYLSNFKKSGSSGVIDQDEITKKYYYTFGVENDSLTAVLKPITYTVVFDPNADNVKGVVSNKSLTYDKKRDIPTNYYKRPGYKFKGWNTEPDGSGTAFESKGYLLNLTDKRGDKVTLYAQWESEDGTMTGSLISNGVIILIAGVVVLVIAIAICIVTALFKKKNNGSAS